MLNINAWNIPGSKFVKLLKLFGMIMVGDNARVNDDEPYCNYIKNQY